jgi:hypothetical protein
MPGLLYIIQSSLPKVLKGEFESTDFQNKFSFWHDLWTVFYEHLFQMMCYYHLPKDRQEGRKREEICRQMLRKSFF